MSSLNGLSLGLQPSLDIQPGASSAKPVKKECIFQRKYREYRERYERVTTEFSESGTRIKAILSRQQEINASVQAIIKRVKSPPLLFCFGKNEERRMAINNLYRKALDKYYQEFDSLGTELDSVMEKNIALRKEKMAMDEEIATYEIDVLLGTSAIAARLICWSVIRATHLS